MESTDHDLGDIFGAERVVGNSHMCISVPEVFYGLIGSGHLRGNISVSIFISLVVLSVIQNGKTDENESISDCVLR